MALVGRAELMFGRLRPPTSRAANVEQHAKHAARFVNGADAAIEHDVGDAQMREGWRQQARASLLCPQPARPCPSIVPRSAKMRRGDCSEKPVERATASLLKSCRVKCWLRKSSIRSYASSRLPGVRAVWAVAERKRSTPQSASPLTRTNDPIVEPQGGRAAVLRFRWRGTR